MAYQIDFLAVGEGERSGDAIAMRFGTLASPKEQFVMVLDGGTKESGAALVNHIKSHYGTTVVDAVICTHSDGDHASGLTEVLENLTVRKLFMHLPWNHVKDLEDQLGKSASTDKVRQHFKKSLENAHELENLAKRKGIPVQELFSDTITPDVFTVLGPSTKFYESLLESFRCAEELNLKESFLEKIFATAERAVKWVAETWSSETLVEPEANASSAENNSSVILLFTEGNKKFLFTSDAGVPALTEAATRAEQLGIDLKTLTGIQIPHHGSKHNVGPAILDRIIGPKVNENAIPTKSAIVSASKGGAPRHPSKRVTNAFIRRGARVTATQGKSILHHSKGASRDNWTPAEPTQFYFQVED